MDIADSDLLARFRGSRDERAFADLVARHQPLVRSACRRVLDDPAAIDDVAQETFWKLAMHADEITTSLGGWLHATATRLAIDWLRRDRRHGRNAVAASALPAAGVGEGAAPDVCRQVLDAVEELPGPERDLIVRHYLLGASLASLSAVTGTPATTIHRRLHQGLGSLRERLRRRGVETPLGCGILLLVAASPWARPGAIPVSPGSVPVPASPAAAPAARRPWRRAAALVACILGLLALLAAWAPAPVPVPGESSDGISASARTSGGPAVPRLAAAGAPDRSGTALTAGARIGLDGGWWRGDGALPAVGAGTPLPPLAPHLVGLRPAPRAGADGPLGTPSAGLPGPRDGRDGLPPWSASSAPEGLQPPAPPYAEFPASGLAPGSSGAPAPGPAATGGQPGRSIVLMSGDPVSAPADP